MITWECIRASTVSASRARHSAFLLELWYILWFPLIFILLLEKGLTIIQCESYSNWGSDSSHLTEIPRCAIIMSFLYNRYRQTMRKKFRLSMEGMAFGVCLPPLSEYRRSLRQQHSPFRHVFTVLKVKCLEGPSFFWLSKTVTLDKNNTGAHIPLLEWNTG